MSDAIFNGVVETAPPTSIRKVVAASMAGTIAEWYEFFIYGVSSTLVFGSLFFPKVDSPLTGIIAAFATYAVGFAARPLGGLVFGHYGDRLGRKKLLQFSLLLVGISTFLMGCIPSFAVIGFWAPAVLILLRFVQGFAVGGEWGGAVLLVSEHSPPEHRGFWASFPQSAACAGNVLASIVLFTLSWMMDKEHFISWGWRIAFWGSAIIIFIGYYIRRSVEDADIFVEAQKKLSEQRKQSSSLKEVLLHYPKQLILGTIIRIGENSVYYIIIVFSITYLTLKVGVDYPSVLFIMFLANIFQFFAMLLGGHISDRIGRKKCILVGYIGLFVWVPFYFPYGLESANKAIILLSICIGLGLQALCYGPQGALLSEIFPTRMRYSGASFCYQIASIFAGSIAPMIAAILFAHYNATAPITIYLVIVCALSTIALFCLHETRHIQLNHVDEKDRLMQKQA
ncbi:MFS transporter [uncultured Bartonella sp.]|uniref:MFS transporter n=1 Tax=uncultured Bartonella sp. TaxID=104108 RepID=UPI0026043C6F|nr:MFS transporter [uncultured Bartonella sp.]